MGCGASTKPAEPAAADPAPALAPAPQPPPVTPIIQEAKASPRGKQNFQIKLKGDWKDYRDDEGQVLERAYLAGFPFAKYSLRGQDYKYDFTKNLQINTGTGKEREFRPPSGLKRPPAPIVPPGPTMVIKVPPGAKGGVTIKVPHPKRPGLFFTVIMPLNATPGKEILVPVPDPDAKAEEPPAAEPKKGGWSKSAAAGSGAAALGVGALVVGGLVVAGAVLGEDTIMAGAGVAGDAAAGAAGAAAGAVAPAGDVIGDAAMTLGDALAPGGEAAIGTAGEIAGSAGGIGGDALGAAGGAAESMAAGLPGGLDAVGGVAADASDWIMNMGETGGGFVMDLFS